MMIKRIVSQLEKHCCGIHPLAAVYKHYYREVVLNEIALGNISRNSRVINVGCGAIPFTAMLLSEITGARVTAMDRDYEASQCAQKSLARFKLDNLVDVLHGDACDYPWRAGRFDVALIALQAEPKSEIIENLSNVVKKLIVRVPSEPFQYQYDHLPPNLEILRSVPQNMKTFNQSVLIPAKPENRGVLHPSMNALS